MKYCNKKPEKRGSIWDSQTTVEFRHGLQEMLKIPRATLCSRGRVIWNSARVNTDLADSSKSSEGNSDSDAFLCLLCNVCLHDSLFIPCFSLVCIKTTVKAIRAS